MKAANGRPKTLVPDSRADGGPSRLRKAVDFLVLAVLVWSPLPAASVGAWSLLVLQLAVALAVGAALFAEDKPRLDPHMLPDLPRLKAGALAVFAYLVFQILPLPAAVVRLISPGTYDFQRLYSPHFARLKFLSLSIVPSATFREGLELLTYVLLGYLVIRFITRGREIRRIILVLVGMGVFQSLYGIYEMTVREPRILFYRKVFSLDSATGTFVNRNHFSGYLEMIIPLALGFVLARMDVFSPGTMGIRKRIVLLSSRGAATSLLVLVGAVVMSLGVVLSRSRSGLFVLVFTFFLFFEFAAFHFSRARIRQRWAKRFVQATFLAVTVAALVVGIGSTIERFALDDLAREDRPVFWGNTLGLVGDFPVFGTGYGTFVSAYPSHETRGGPELLLVHAHNEYLEWLSELGVVGTALLLSLLLYPVVRTYLIWAKRRNPEVKGLALGGIVSLAGAGVHAMTDFALHIPANAVLFTVVLSLTFVLGTYRKS
jgi:O-antigen ligase/nitrate reductase NapE component